MPRWDVRFDLHLNLADERLLRAVIRAEALSGVIQGIPLPPLTRQGLDRLNIIRAVRGTTGIEGADLTAEEVGRIVAAPGEAVLGAGRAREEKEARNALEVMRVVAARVDSVPDMPITEDLIRDLHALTTGGIDYPRNEPGRYRSGEVTAATYRAPDAAVVPQLMKRFVAWANSRSTSAWPPVARAVAAHFYFISIHPFGDGNGRTARAIESLILYQRGINTLGFYSLSNFYYRRRADYIEMLDHTRFGSGHDLTRLVTFAAEGLLSELEIIRDEVLEANRRVAFRDYARQLLATEQGIRAPVRERLVAVMALLQQVEAVAESEVTDGQSALAGLYGRVGGRAFSRDVDALVRLGLATHHAGAIQANYDVMSRFIANAQRGPQPSATP